MFLPMFFVPFLTQGRPVLVCVFGYTLGNDKRVGLRDKMYNNCNMFNVLLVVPFLCFHESRRSLSSQIRFYVNGLKPRYWMVDSKMLQWVSKEDSRFTKGLMKI